MAKKKTTKRKTSTGLTAGQKKIKAISARASIIYKKNPNKKWTDCIKQASKELK
ncbi:hypothetical protein ACE193_15165 [Bernardetia sp. OM2101]|uniref:hypothetical protein n=1 Tax=Bernardetia sp. OM2101 TaxID=3344876 RepID=UPI0035CFAB6C